MMFGITRQESGEVCTIIHKTASDICLLTDESVRLEQTLVMELDDLWYHGIDMYRNFMGRSGGQSQQAATNTAEAEQLFSWLAPL